MSITNLSSLLVSTKATEVDYPGLTGFKVNVAFLSREELIKIRKKATKTAFKNRQQTEELNEELFLQLYVQSVVKGWSGLKLRHLESLVPIDLSGQKDLEAELDFSEENALMLMKNSTEFDSFISETVGDLGNFNKSSGNV
jgi:hypothetical protein